MIKLEKIGYHSQREAELPLKEALAAAGWGFLFVVLFILLAVVLILLMNVKLRIRLEDTFTYSFGIGPFAFDSQKAQQSKRKVKKKTPKIIKFTGESRFGELVCTKEKEKKKKTEKRAKQEKRQAEEEKKSLFEQIELVKSIVTEWFERFGKYAVIKIKKLHMTAAAQEPSDTAVMFGFMNAASGTLLHVCSKFRVFEMNPENVAVYSDFTGQSPELRADIQLKIKVWQLLICTLGALKVYLAQR